MAEQFPLVVKSGVVQEIASGDDLNLLGNEIVGINSITFANGATLSGATGIGSTVTVDIELNVNGLHIGRGANGSVGYSTLGSGQIAANIVLGAGNILGQFTGIATGGGTPAIGIGNSVLINYTGLGTEAPFGNTAIGHEALLHVTTGGGNYAIGRASQFSQKTGNNNISIGDATMIACGIDQSVLLYGGPESEQVNDNIAIGGAALFRARSSSNTAIGRAALLFATTGEGNNTALGYEALRAVTTGGRNTGVGNSAGTTITTGFNNTCIGFNAAVSVATTSNQIVLGDSNVTDLRCNVTSISAVSDERDKTDIVDLPVGLDFVNSLRPVKFAWDRRDGSMVGIQEAGFIAQELDAAQGAAGAEDYLRLVLKANPEQLEAAPGKLIPVLVKAIQELSARVAELEAQ